MRLSQCIAVDGIDVASGRLWSLGAIGIEQCDNATDSSDTAMLIATFPDTETSNRAQEHEPSLRVCDEAEPVPARPFCSVTRIAGFVIAAPWDSPWLDPNDTHLSIDPRSAFGHGGHPTTKLLLEWIGESNLGGLTVIDVGCGSGVLAIAAAKRGAKGVLAIDTDADAVECATANAAANNADQVTVLVLDATELVQRQQSEKALIDRATPADLALVNLTVDGHEAVGPAVAPASNRIFASGFLESQVDRVAAAYRGHQVKRRHRDGEWWALHLER